jgi:hypothetical protein
MLFRVPPLSRQTLLLSTADAIVLGCWLLSLVQRGQAPRKLLADGPLCPAERPSIPQQAYRQQAPCHRPAVSGDNQGRKGPQMGEHAP